MERFLFGLAALGLSVAIPPAWAQEIFSAGAYVTPETIAPAPANFGSYGGEYFIPDFNLGIGGPIWVVPPTGGPPSTFATNPDIAARGGLFLPQFGWGADSGKFLELGPGIGSQVGGTYTFAPDGTRSLFQEIPGASPAQPQIAPSSFGSHAGQLIIADSGDYGNPRILTIAPDHTVTTLVTAPVSSPFGMAFAPAAGFGNLNSRLFVDSSNNGQVVSVGPDGSVRPFATIPLKPGQTSPFEMAFSPAGFLPGYGELLFVSVRGSQAGEGTLGDVVALDSDGHMVASLRTDLGLSRFDPRGFYFVDDQTLLLSDASDGQILLIRTSDFATPTPEPSTLLLLGIGAAGLIAWARWLELLAADPFGPSAGLS